ncbi:peroxide/acid stress response protein YhcN [Serratia proteamaculans]|jgi:type 1 fimbria pilin|uniref:Peroxide/acid stress response protein YhcN n=2 Tax=Serratia TaxID=613 RepID=A0A2X2JPN1_9GAMM|nr:MULTISPECIES: peroxide/acid stress response protein YhcN [Serratia]MBV6693021.1 peroxide/acid stress response protein YhcN [Serratia quinivorans]MCS4269253.1 type 1 fimbria pilin [Serratia sp. BIGb0163]NTX80369.1 peroxide/acid stress response protein YhcN [Serratia proteamaculans]NTZ29208.1 peroxide/acid stress response protein YhcN [Serratia proteamaculans]QBX67282.1 peroxide/acid stress response protein YhcN [Serratia quinivorans]
MKIKATIATMSVLSMLSFGAFAAQSVDANQAANMQSAGTITVSGVAGAPSDIRQALSEKADAKGATAYRVIEARNEGNFHATAEIYK